MAVCITVCIPEAEAEPQPKALPFECAGELLQSWPKLTAGSAGKLTVKGVEAAALLVLLGCKAALLPENEKGRGALPGWLALLLRKLIGDGRGCSRAAVAAGLLPACKPPQARVGCRCEAVAAGGAADPGSLKPNRPFVCSLF